MRFQTKAFVSLLLSAVFLTLGLSGVMLYLCPRGRVANWTDWTLLGLDKQSWQSLHINFALGFLILAALHLYFNWGLFWGYLKKKGQFALNLKWETLAALVVTAVIVLGIVFRVSPFTKLMVYNNRMKDYWDQWAAQPPSPHAEELSLKRFAAERELSLPAVLEAMRAEGLEVRGPEATLAEIAQQNRVTPSEVYARIKKHFPEIEERVRVPGKGQGMGPGKGRGRHQQTDW